MKITSWHRLKNGILLDSDNGMLKVEIPGRNIFRIVYTKDKEFSTKSSLMVLPQAETSVSWEASETETEILLSTASLRLVVSRKTGAFSYFDAAGKLLAREPEKGGKTLVPVDVVKTVFDNGTEITEEKSVDGVRTRVDNFTKVVDRQAYKAKLEFVWADKEALYGLGSHEEGIFNLRGHHRYLYQQNMKAVVPMLVSTNGYGILLDSYSSMTFHDDEYGSYLWSETEDELDYYFIYGPQFDPIIKGYRKLTGKAPMLPKWAFGYVQSKERYETQEEILQVVKEYRDRQIPLDLIVLDWKSWTGELWGQKSFDPERFPDPTGMMQQLHDLDARLMISIWPIMRAGGENHREMLENGCLLGNQANYDAFSEKARALYWKQAKEGLFSKGIDAWWCDCTEPFEADWNGELKPEPEERQRINTNQSKKFLDPEYINAFSLLHSQGIYEGQRKVTDQKRVVNLTRSAYAGQHRYSTITWSGDIVATWDTMRRQIAEGLNFCATGEPYWTLDIGAFFTFGKKGWSRWCSDPSIPAPWFLAGDFDGGCEDPGYRELYVRWFQYGAFLPMFRSHGTDTPREVWRFGEPGTMFYDTLVKYDQLRYRLMPYIYSLAGKVTLEDYTMMRALAFDFTQDGKTYDVADQYMFGPAFLVNPVTKPMYYESDARELPGEHRERPVYLPEGCHWVDFWTGNRYSGGQTIQAAAPLEILPLFVRDGSIVPMGPVVQHTGEKPDAPLELRIYRGADGVFELYEDEGDNYNYEKGAYATIRLEWQDAAGRLVFGRRKGSFPGMVEKRRFDIVLVETGNGTGLEDAAKVTGTVEYTGGELIVEL